MDRRRFLRQSGWLTGVALVPVFSGCGSSTDPAGLEPPADGPAAFNHGVASGDPLSDRVILWTRVTPAQDGPVAVRYQVATDPALQDVVNSGTVTTDAARDFTVKVDAGGLQPATTYWYAFTALGYRSPIGRTRTAPAVGQGITELTIGHVACTSWRQDFFNGYARMGERGDIDLITHAGDPVYAGPYTHLTLPTNREV